MKSDIYDIQANWDPEASVWVAMSPDVSGLATEAATIEALTYKLRTMIPDLLKANGLLLSGSITFALTSHRREVVLLAL